MFTNLLHWTYPNTGENEFEFKSEYFNNFISLILNLVHYLFEFWGHYGLQLFIFISAYVLTIRYNRKKPSYLKFIFERLYKLYPVFLISVLLYAIVHFFWYKIILTPLVFKKIFILLSLFANFIPQKALSVNGPWWFYSFIFQLYLLFPLLHRLITHFKSYSFYLISTLALLCSYFLYSPVKSLGVNLNHMFIGHMPEFCLGIWFAKKGVFKIPLWLPFITLLGWISSNIIEELWPFSNICAVITLIIFLRFVIEEVNIVNFVKKHILNIGGLSMYLFACHGFLRYQFTLWANSFQEPMATYGKLLIFNHRFDF
jgi:peptidoglycan/LPS O-acetylase OafA/YrhL